MRACRALGALTLLVLGLVAFTPVTDRLQPPPAPPPRPAQAIVVLGSYMGTDGTLSAASLQRAVRGIQLYRHGLAPLLVMAGAQQGPLAEAEVRAALAREFGVPAEALLTEGGGKTTREEALRMRQLLQPRGVRDLLLVTSADHMPRAQEEFEREGFTVAPAPVAGIRTNVDRPEDRLGQARRWAQELGARLYYRARAAFS
jgi:uncharacterized SAM-binding protein YcdF (DUF218 family)